MNRTGIVLLALAAALALGGLGFWLGRNAQAPAAAGDAPASEATRVAAGTVARPAEPERAAASTRATTPAAATPATVAPASLPPPNTPVAQIYDQLAARARAGDARAACRLANDLNACRSLARLREERDGFDHALLHETAKAKPSPQRLKQLLAQQEQFGARLAESERQCGGLSSERVDEAFDWLKLAADQGHVPSMARFASDPLVPPNRVVRELDRMLLYRANAPRYAQAALAAGNAEIVAALADAYRTKSAVGGTLLSQVMPEDPVQAFAYLLLSRRIQPVAPQAGGSDAIELQRADLDPEQQSRAERLADELHARYFEDRAPTPTPPPRPKTSGDVGGWWCERER